MSQIINNAVSVDTFSKIYPVINKYMMESAETEHSRNGTTKEILNFKTEVTNPYKRCVGTCKRDINIFFLLAEAMWIFTGRKDVKFLLPFNAQMGEYSDDGLSFHAPYGFRLRNYGVNSFDKPTEEANHYLNNGTDQILEALKMLKDNPQDRRVVLSIWDAHLDLNKKSKDLPCNDLVMFKVRRGKLHTTISNRSNDLHWGLPTNVFQFSFLSEVISNILGIELGTQVHNSQSLHIYTENKIAWKMYEEYQFANGNVVDLYDQAYPLKMNIKFKKEDVDGRLEEADAYMRAIIRRLEDGTRNDEPFKNRLKEFSKFFYFTYELLEMYLEYKEIKEKTDDVRRAYMNKVMAIFKGEPQTYDLKVLACNFFASRVSNNNDLTPLGKF